MLEAEGTGRKLPIRRMVEPTEEWDAELSEFCAPPTYLGPTHGFLCA